MHKVSRTSTIQAFRSMSHIIWDSSFTATPTGPTMRMARCTWGNFHTVMLFSEPRPSEKWEPGKPITKWNSERRRRRSVSAGWNYSRIQDPEDAHKTIYLMYTANTGRGNFIFAQKMKSWMRSDAFRSTPTDAETGGLSVRGSEWSRKHATRRRRQHLKMERQYIPSTAWATPC